MPRLVASSVVASVLLFAAGIAHAQPPLVISQLRYRGTNGASDEFVEIYNDSDEDHTVQATAGTGYGVAASDGLTRFTIANGTVIPARGHFLGVNSVGYSLASYPGGNGLTATGDVTYTTNIPENVGIAIFDNNAGGASYSLARRIDAVGSTVEQNTLYKEGAGFSPLVGFSIDYAMLRAVSGTGPIVPPKSCMEAMTGAAPGDTNDNAKDFIFVDTNGTNAGNGQRLGAPAPRNLSSPRASLAGAISGFGRLDKTVSVWSPPNMVRDFSSNPAANSTFGTIDVRRTFTNDTSTPITRLRFRVVAISTFPAPSGVADLRPRTSTAVVVTRAKVGGGTENVTVQGTTLEQPPSQPNGGGFNSTMSVPTVTIATPLAPGASVDVRFLFGLQQEGAFQIFVEAEATPSVRSSWGMIMDPKNPAANADCTLIGTTTTVTSEPRSTEGQPVTLTAHAQPLGGAADVPAMGEVAFLDGKDRIGVAKLVDGKANITTTALVAGSHSITAVYFGNGAMARSSSQPLALEIDPAPVHGAGGAVSSDDLNGGGATGGTGASEVTAADDAGSAGDDAGGCNAGRRTDASSASFLGLLVAAMLVAARRRRV